MSTNGHRHTAVLYARVSTQEQASIGYSLRQQLEALRVWCKREGYEVLAEVSDPGHSGAYLERPGLDRVRDLVQSDTDGVSVVLAQDADRITRDPIHRAFLDEEMQQFGTRLMALDDWGDNSHEGELLRYMKGWVSKGERLKIAERTRRGKLKKLGEGLILKCKRPPYGFSYDRQGEALVVSEDMAVVRRIFRMMGAEGETLGGVVKRLTAEGVPSPTCGNWSRQTLRYVILNELYLPRAAEELEGLVSANVLAGLDTKHVYGLWTWNKRRRRKWRERGEDGTISDRYRYEMRPMEEWAVVPVDLTDAGLSWELVNAARERISDNKRRPPSNVAQRFWQLSGGIARCAECGYALTPHTVPRPTKIDSYYRCHQRYNSGPRDCTNSRSMRAPALEEAVWTAIIMILSEPERLLRQYEEHIERQRRQMRGDPDREARELHGKLRKLERRRSGYLDLAADGDMSREDLRSKIANVDEQREGLRKALKEAEARRQALRRSESHYAQIESLLDVNAERLDRCSAEDRQRVYRALRLQVHIDEDRSVRLSGVFSPEMYLLDVLRDEPDMDMPRPELMEEKGSVVTLDSSR